MPRILYAPASPYSAKVRMAAAFAGIEFTDEIVDTNADPTILVDSNPLGKIPVLLTDDGEPVYDSRAITQYLNRISRSSLFPRSPAKRLEAERLEALADGICDCLLAQVYERRFRPGEKLHQPWIDRQWEKTERALDALNAKPPGLPGKISAGQIALRACLAYLDLRFEGRWEKGRLRLRRWGERFDGKFPDLVQYLPK